MGRLDTIVETPRSKRWSIAALLLFCCVAIVGFMTVRDYGQSWDEHFRFAGGDQKLAYYKALVTGDELPVMNDSYPGLFDLPLAAAHELFPEWGTRSEKGHVLSLLFGLAGLLAAWRLTARLGGARAGFWAMLLLITLPRYYGHMFINPKDVPLAATYLLGLWALVALFSKLPRPGWRAVMWVGLAAGVAMSTRIAGLLILCYFGLFVFLYLLCQYIARLREGRGVSVDTIGKDLGCWALRGAVAGLIALIPLLVFWPALHGNFFSRVGGTLETVQSFGWSGPVLMDGHFWQSVDLPIYYIPYWIMVTVPELILVLFLLGALVGAGQLYATLRRGKFAGASKLWPRLVLVFGFVFPLGYLFWKDPVLYDGLRHYLFVLPPMVCIGALGLEWLLRRARRAGSPVVSASLQIGAGFAVCLVAVEMVALHPYQYIYFNQASGGLPAAYMRDETDYWGTSHKAAGEWLNRYAEEIDPAGERHFKVHLTYSRWMLKPFLNDRFELTPEHEGADFYVAVTRFNAHARYPDAPILYVVERQGVPLCYVFDLSKNVELEVEESGE